MDGMPARMLVIGLTTLYTGFGQYLAINAAISSPIGTPTASAPAVTKQEPTIIVPMP